MHELDRADVEAARRLRRQQQRGWRSISRASTSFCWLPPESARAGARRRAAAHVEALDQARRARSTIARGMQPAEARDRLALVVVQRAVLGQAEVEHEAVALAVLRGCARCRLGGALRGDACVTSRVARAGSCPRRRGACRRPPRRARSARCRRRRRCRRSRPRAPRSERPRTVSMLAVVEHVEVVDRRAPASPGCAAPRSTSESTRPPDHQLGEAALGRPGRVDRRDLLAAAQHADAVGDLQDLVELVRDDDDRRRRGRAARAAPRAARTISGGVSTAVGSSRISTLRVAVERLQDLDALLRADADVLDERARIDREAVAVRELAHALLGGRHVEQRPARAARRRARCSRRSS